MERFDPEAVDLAAVAEHLHATVGPSVAGSVVGRTVLRDAVIVQLRCSQLEAELVVDTMIGRGFLVAAQVGQGLDGWRVRPPRPSA